MNTAISEADKIRKAEKQKATQWEAWDRLFQSPAFLEYMEHRAAHSSELPRDIGAEQATIGACLMANHQDVRYLELACSLLASADFFYTPSRLAFIAINSLNKQRLIKKEMQIDLFTVVSYLRFHRKIGECTPAFLTSCIESCPSVTNVAAYAEAVRTCSMQRKLITLSQMLSNTEILPEQSINAARKALDDIETASAANIKKLFEVCK